MPPFCRECTKTERALITSSPEAAKNERLLNSLSRGPINLAELPLPLLLLLPYRRVIDVVVVVVISYVVVVVIIVAVGVICIVAIIVVVFVIVVAVIIGIVVVADVVIVRPLKTSDLGANLDLQKYF